MQRIGIIGGGISGICAALRLQKLRNNTIIEIVEAQPELGGRIFCKTIKHQATDYHFDIGANLIDFESKEIAQIWNLYVPETIKSQLVEFKGDFLIYDDNKLRIGDYYKERYFYKSGFSAMIRDFEGYLNKETVNILLNSKTTKITNSPGLKGIYTIEHKNNNQLATR